MDSFITVHANGKDLKVQAEVNGEVSIETLRRAFLLEDSVPVSLLRDDVALKSVNSVFHLGDEWKSANYRLVWEDARRSRPQTPMEAKSDASIMKFFNYLFYLMDGNTRVCITIIEKDLAATASHCIPKDKKVNDLLTIFDQLDNAYEVNIIFQNKELDLALLQTVENDFEVEPLEVGLCEVGKAYFALGYPLDGNTGRQFIKSPNAVKGSIMTGVVRKNCVYGDSGGSKGFSGGPVISLDPPRQLIGIALGGRGFPKTWPLDNFLVRVLSFCGETPRLKIFPVASALTVMTAANVERKGVKRSAPDEDMQTTE